ncbi:MAG TPA: Gfo/Idh/MocA family oxidoreductase [Candidatus Dormibacteraeota bacterium]|nr:Gfo/Idh/MocA family oxidoreductase [Candidatus Dormibacteraeota bacterium]
MAPLRILQVGLGPHGRNWARQVLPNLPEIQTVAYVDKDPNALDVLREEARVPAELCFESLKEAMEATHPEAMLNTTALQAHVPVTRAGLEAGLHVLVEKPFAPTLEAARSLVEEAALRRLVLMVSQNYRFFPAPRVIASMVHESSLGRLHEVSIDFRRYSTAGPNGRVRHHLEEQPLLVDMSIHHFDLLRLILSREPQRIYCEAWNPEWTSFSGPSVAVASIVFEGGVVVSYRGSWISAAPITPWAGEWRMEFENGEVTWTSAADSDSTQDRVVVRLRGGAERVIALPAASRTGTSASLTEFAAAIAAGREPETSGRQNLGTIALMEAAVESASLRQAVTVHRTGETVTI